MTKSKKAISKRFALVAGSLGAICLGAVVLVPSLTTSGSATDREPLDSETTTPASTPQELESWTKGGMVSAADPRAVAAGVEVLNNGGHAVDAAIAAHAMLSLVEPQSSGIGGGSFMVVRDRANGETKTFDGRETAPASATSDMFLDENGEVIDGATDSGLSTGVPSQVKLYEAAHEAYGSSEWSTLFEPTIELATNGFEVSPRLASLVASTSTRSTNLDEHPESAAYFYPGGDPIEAGFIRDNPALANLLQEISTEGSDAFYLGENAEAIVATTNAAPNAGAMTVEDIAGYEIETKDALCGDHTIAGDAFEICSAQPPSSGGVAQNMAFGLYQRLMPEGPQSFDDDASLQAFVDAQRLMYADRDHYVGDPNFDPVPAEDLINPIYLDARVAQRFEPSESPSPGDPGEVLRSEPIIDTWGRDTTTDTPGTTHISVIDNDGNAVSLTATVESGFGNSRMVNGYLLNNELTDFAYVPELNGKPVVNAPGPGKRPRSSMAPTIVLDADKEVSLVTGSPGGNSILGYVAKTLVGTYHWDLTAQQAVDLPNIIARGDEVDVEVGVAGGNEAADRLELMGYTVDRSDTLGSGLNIIAVREDSLEGAADNRREGSFLSSEG